MDDSAQARGEATVNRNALFEQIAKAQITQRAERFREGKYVLIVKKLLLEEKRKGTFFIGEFLVKEAIRVREGVDPNAVGTSVGFALNLTTNYAAAGNAKAFVLALLGASEEPSEEELVAALGELTGPNQPARGMLVGGETYHSTTRAGGDFVGVNFFRIQQTAEEVAKRRADMDAGRLAA